MLFKEQEVKAILGREKERTEMRNKMEKAVCLGRSEQAFLWRL